MAEQPAENEFSGSEMTDPVTLMFLLIIAVAIVMDKMFDDNDLDLPPPNSGIM